MTQEAAPQMQELKAFEVPITMVKVEPAFNIRKDVSVSPELLASIKASGIIQPLQVRTRNGKQNVLWVVDGERRYQAAKLAKLQTVPVFHNGELSDADALIVSMTTANQQPFTDAELRTAVVRLSDKGLSLEDIIANTGYSERKIREYLRIEQLATPEVKTANLPSRVAARAAGLPPEKQKEVVEKIKGKDREEAMKTVRTEEAKMGKKARGPAADSYPIVKKPKEVLKDVERFLNRMLQENARNQIRRAQMNVVKVMKGEMSLEEFSTQ